MLKTFRHTPLTLCLAVLVAYTLPPIRYTLRLITMLTTRTLSAALDIGDILPEINAVRCCCGQFVTALIFRVSRMPADPHEADSMYIAQVKQSCPQVSIFGRVFLRAHPVIGAPFTGPSFVD
jgi:hypothetical protein